MERRTHTPSAQSLVLSTAMLFQSFWLSAQSGIARKIVEEDQVNSLYIIGSVLVFGIIAYFVYSMIERNRKREENKPSGRRSVSHRHHHSHRVIKKSA